MPAKNAANAPWQDLEKQAYHAYREWPIWLALRERELEARVQSNKVAKPSQSTSTPNAKGSARRDDS
jgi:hypothetical protein